MSAAGARENVRPASRIVIAASGVAMWLGLLAALTAAADTPPDSTWVALRPLPHQGRVAVFALAVDPSNDQVVIAGNSQGSLLRSTDGGITWTTVHTSSATLSTIAFDPYTAGLVLAGTRGSGALLSRNGGVTWSAAEGLDGRSVRVFGFSLTILVAGTDRGVYASQDGITWTQSGLSNQSISSLAVEAIHAPVRLIAGGDSQSSGGLPLYQSIDGAATWTQINPLITGTIAVKLVAGPLPPTGNIRPLLLGTNTGLFVSRDNGASFTPLSGGSLLPATDYTQVSFIANHYNRFYAASDGGGSGSGGLWRTDDDGQSFTWLAPPEASVTGLAVSSDQSPFLYVATFRPTDHVASLWVYHDTGATPQGPGATPTPVASGSRKTGSSNASWLLAFFSSPQLPYEALGIGALAIILTAVAAHLRGRSR